jgi:transcriptional regulator with XRE-family HTH domain
MNLRRYKYLFRISYSSIARQCGCSPEMISLIASGKTSPSFDLAVRIERATLGHVRRDNWFPPRPPDISIIITGISA